MSIRLSSKTIVLFCALLPIVTLVPDAPALETVEKRLTLELEVSEDGTLEIENLLGSVYIKSSREKGKARVDARVVAEAKSGEEANGLLRGVDLQRSNEASGPVVHVTYPLDSVDAFRMPKAGVKGLLSRWTGAVFRNGAANVEYEGKIVTVGKDRKAAGLAVYLTVTVPIDVHVAVRQRVGSVDARFLRGDLDLAVVDGTIDVESCYGGLRVEAVGAGVNVAAFQGRNLEIKTDTGVVDIERIRVDRATVRTASGAVRCESVIATELSIESGSGEVKFQDVSPRDAEVRTESGDVDLAMRLKSTKSAAVHSESGDVVLRIGKHINFGLQAETQSGKVRTIDLDLVVVEQDGNSSRLQRGKGGIDLRVATGQGSLTVCPYDAKPLQVLTGRSFQK